MFAERIPTSTMLTATSLSEFVDIYSISNTAIAVLNTSEFVNIYSICNTAIAMRCIAKQAGRSSSIRWRVGCEIIMINLERLRLHIIFIGSCHVVIILGKIVLSARQMLGIPDLQLFL